MKTQLTKGQSQHLIDLGVPKEKASEKISYGFLGYDPIFQLTDILEILPKEIQEDYIYWLTIDITNGCSEVCYFAGRVVNKEMGYKMEKELIDALYELACWYYERKS